jgi:hypothetical protein
LWILIQEGQVRFIGKVQEIKNLISLEIIYA